jgi:AraC-like DNA-binding protein
VLDQLKSGTPSKQSIAKHLGFSPRTLDRRLTEEGLTFQSMLDDLRRESALRHLEDPAVSVDDTAFLLGFSSAEAFRKAFNRWTGRTPGEYRKKNR